MKHSPAFTMSGRTSTQIATSDAPGPGTYDAK